MTSAPSPAVRDPLQCLTGLAEVHRHLRDDYGITIIPTDLDDTEVVDYDETSGILLLRRTATLHQQLYGLRQIWWLHACGPWAAPAVRKQRRLTLVPAIAVS